MAKTSSIHIRVDSKTKENAEKILNTLEMTMAEAINIYLKQIILHSGIPFQIKVPKFSDEMLEALQEAEKMMKHPENHKSFDSIEDFMEDLHNEI